MKKIKIALVLVLLALLPSLQVLESDGSIEENIQLDSGWKECKNNKYLDVIIKNSQGENMNPETYNLTVFVKRTDNFVDEYYNQTFIAFISTAKEFRIFLQTKEKLSLSYSLYLLYFDHLQVSATASVKINEVTVKEGNSVPIAFIPVLVSLIVFGIKVNRKKRI